MGIGGGVWGFSALVIEGVEGVPHLSKPPDSNAEIHEMQGRESQKPKFWPFLWPLVSWEWKIGAENGNYRDYVGFRGLGV